MERIMNKFFFFTGILLVWCSSAIADLAHIKAYLRAMSDKGLLGINCNYPPYSGHGKLDLTKEGLAELIDDGLLRDYIQVEFRNCNIVSLPENLDKLNSVK